MFDLLKAPVVSFQEFVLLAGRTFRGLLRTPHYADDIFLQMDIIGVGSLPVVILTGFFSGAVMALQMSRALEKYGATSQVGQITAITLVREMGPVLTSLMVAGRNASGMASELGSMKVTEQIDAMRALGTDPIQKLIKPRLIATAFVLPLLTIIADFVGIIGGWLVACLLLKMTTTSQFWNNCLAGLGVQRHRARASQALYIRYRHRPGRLLLRHPHHGRHAGRRPRHHAGRGRRVGMGGRPHLHHRPRIREHVMSAPPILSFERVSLSFDESGPACRIFHRRGGRVAHHPRRGRQR